MKLPRYIKRISILSLLISFCIMFGTMAQATVQWYNLGCEWAARNGLTGVTNFSSSSLDEEVSLDDLYSTIIKYIKLKNVVPDTKTKQHVDASDRVDGVFEGIATIIDGYISRDSLTMQQYYVVETYVDKGYETLEKYRDLSDLLTREDLKQIDLYLKLCKYKAATLVDNRYDKDLALQRAGYVKNSYIIDIGMMPYISTLSRKEFLLLMYDILNDSDKTSEEDILNSFAETDILRGYETGYELDKKLSYREMYVFLYRMENYDFEESGAKTAFYGFDDILDEAMSGSISSNDFVDFLNEIYYNTNSQIDLVKTLDDALGEDWSVSDAGSYLYDIYHEKGFSYTSGRTTIKVSPKDK